ncbi:hypothetical protein C4D60_Mb08t17350 [Musa balbisiana]|uniref:SAM domain-containing protein n=1 Tax=Musa balbisiana TaxID=52838 RepID=A0A4S8K4G9_MUSBA|nr:hypothetical protein C4D60_Mb08t17350 [Musa balbisiana]
MDISQRRQLNNLNTGQPHFATSHQLAFISTNTTIQPSNINPMNPPTSLNGETLGLQSLPLTVPPSIHITTPLHPPSSTRDTNDDAMDWYSWLLQTNLDPDLVYEYSLLLSSSELEEDDVAHFDHEFLQSMGISIAKHRLEMLKLAKRGKIKSSSRPVALLLVAVTKTKKCIARYFRSFINLDASPIVVVPRSSYFDGGEPKSDTSKRNKWMSRIKQGRVTLYMAPQAMAYKESKDRKEDSYRGSSGEETRGSSSLELYRGSFLQVAAQSVMVELLLPMAKPH